MKKLDNNIYYKRLAKLRTMPLLAFTGIVFIFFVTEISIFYYRFIPNLLLPLRKIDAPTLTNHLETGYIKILVALIVCALFFLITNIMLIYTVWNLNKYIQSIEE